MKRQTLITDDAITIVAAAQTDIGRCRATNMDAVVVNDAQGLYAVTDGMGGVSKGAEAAAFVAQELPHLVDQFAMKGMMPTCAGLLLAQIVANISGTLYERTQALCSDESNLNTGYGATLCAAWFIEDTAVFANLGDSRAYILRKGARKMSQITRDHNWAADLVELGLLAAIKAKNHPTARALRRYCGMMPPAIPDVFIEKIALGDKILICSDGLYGMLPDTAITRILRAAPTPAAACAGLIAAANEAGGQDNIATVVANVVSPPKKTRKRLHNRAAVDTALLSTFQHADLAIMQQRSL